MDTKTGRQTIEQITINMYIMNGCRGPRDTSKTLKQKVKQVKEKKSKDKKKKKYSMAVPRVKIYYTKK